MDKKTIMTFIAKQKTGFIASIDQEGFPNMKAMLAPRRIEGDCFYFTTNKCSMRVSQYLANPKASIYFYERGRFKYFGVMLIGNMEVCEDIETKTSIWRLGDTMYYHGGINDPDYVVLKFTAVKCRYYSALKTENVSWNEE